jgi:hypothetical protein
MPPKRGKRRETMMTQPAPRDPHQKPPLERWFDWKQTTGIGLTIGGNTLTETLEITIPDLKLEGQ